MAEEKIRRVRVLPRPTGGGNGQRFPGGNGGVPGGDGEAVAPRATAQVGLWFFLVAVTMLFVAFTVSYTARRTASDWTAVALPRVLTLNTVVLVASSAALEWGRRRWRQGDEAGLRRGLLLTAGLGVGFLAGQITAWRELAASGVFMGSNPHSAFFHLLTGVHGLHLLGGLGALGYALHRTGGALLQTPDETTALATAVATYWHFLTVLWLYVWAILVA